MSLAQVLANYSAVENLCLQDPCGAIDAQAGVFNWNPQALAYSYGVRHGVIAPVTPDPVVAERAAITEQQINDFRSDPRNEFFDLVRPRMGELIGSGNARNLGEAYIMACDESAPIQEIEMARKRAQMPVNPYVRNSAVPKQARMQSKAIGGAPSSSTPSPRQSNSAGTPYDDVKAAVERQRR